MAHTGLVASIGVQGAIGKPLLQTMQSKRHVMVVKLEKSSAPLLVAPALPLTSISQNEAELSKLEKATDQSLTKWEPLGDAASSSVDIAIGEQGDESVLLPIAVPHDPHYFSGKELTRMPQVQKNIPSATVFNLPDNFPHPALVRLLINEQGDVDHVVIEDTFLSEKAERIVKNAFSKMKFLPGRRGDDAVKSQLKIEVMLENANTTTLAAPRVIEQISPADGRSINGSIQTGFSSPPDTLTPPSSLPTH